MPYRIEGNCVQVNRSGRWQTVKCHPNHAKALAHLRALEANVSEAKEPTDKEMIRPSQAEAEYTLLSTTTGQACANCRWLIGDDYCHLISNYPDDILVTGWCNRWEARPEMPEPEPMPVVIVGDESKEGEHEQEIPQESETEAGEASDEPTAPAVEASEQPDADKSSFIAPVAAWIKAHLLSRPQRPTAGFKAIPDRNVWLAWWTTTTKDLEGEVFAPQAIDAFIERVDKGLTPYPELWFGHLPLRHGQAKWLARIGQIAVAAGTFDETPLAQKMQAWYRRQTKELPVSHGFKYIQSLKRGGVYYHFDTFEISPLHPIYMKAANPTAKFSEVMNMKDITPEKMQALTDVLGSDELAKQVAQEALAAIEQKSKAMDGEGIGFKTDTDAPDIPVIDAEARKELDALKTAQANTDKAIADAVANAVKETGETIANALKAELDKRDATIQALTEKVAAMETARKEEQELHAPASQSLITQILAGGKAHDDALELQKKNAEPDKPSVVDRFLGGQLMAQG